MHRRRGTSRAWSHLRSRLKRSSSALVFPIFLLIQILFNARNREAFLYKAVTLIHWLLFLLGKRSSMFPLRCQAGHILFASLWVSSPIVLGTLGPNPLWWNLLTLPELIRPLLLLSPCLKLSWFLELFLWFADFLCSSIFCTVSFASEQQASLRTSLRSKIGSARQIFFRSSKLQIVSKLKIFEIYLFRHQKVFLLDLLRGSIRLISPLIRRSFSAYFSNRLILQLEKHIADHRVARFQLDEVDFAETILQIK